eukprot:SAG22_NODE_228_length_14619_cov_4.604132_1_plen_240_part_00
MALAWDNKMKAAKQMAPEIKAEIKRIKSSGATEAGAERAQQKSEIEMYLRQLNDDIAELDSKLEQPPLATSEDYTKRRTAIGEMRKQCSDLEKMWRAKGNTRTKNELMGSSPRGGAGPVSRSDPVREDESTIGLSNDGMLGMQQQVLRQQDQQFEDIHSGVRRVKLIGENIRDEGTLQDRLLDEVYDGQEAVQRKLQREQTNMEKIMKNGKNGGSMCIICLLIIALVICCVLAFKMLFS